MEIRNVPVDRSSAHGDLIITAYDDKSINPVTYPNYKYILDLYRPAIDAPPHYQATFGGTDSYVPSMDDEFPIPWDSYTGTGFSYTAELVTSAVSGNFTVQFKINPYETLMSGVTMLAVLFQNGEVIGVKKFFAGVGCTINRTIAITAADEFYATVIVLNAGPDPDLPATDNLGSAYMKFDGMATPPELLLRLKSFPNPDNSCGLFNIGMIARNYVGNRFDKSANGIVAKQFGNNEFFCYLQAFMGEEYGDTEYLNLVEDQPRKYYNHYNGRLLSGYTILDGYADKFATNAPASRWVRLDSNLFVPYFAKSGIAITLSITATLLDSSTSTVTYGYTPTADNLVMFNLSPDAINFQALGLTINETVKKYTVTIGDQEIVFNLYCEPKYTPYTLHWLNKLGGYDSFDFVKKSVKTLTSIEKKSFTKLQYVMDASGFISNYSDSGKVLNEGVSVYNTQWKEKLKLNSDNISEAEYAWLAELVTSPQIFIEQEDVFVPVIITQSDYDFKNAVNDRVFNLTIDVEYGDTQNAQYR